MLKTFVFKFGGASIKDADSIKNLSKILYNRLRNHTVIVVSAMGKTTNSLKTILEKKIAGEDYSSNITILKMLHLKVCEDLFDPEHSIHHQIENHFMQLSRELEQPLHQDNYDQAYDQIIAYGELMATRMVQETCAHKIFFVSGKMRGHSYKPMQIIDLPK